MQIGKNNIFSFLKEKTKQNRRIKFKKIFNKRNTINFEVYKRGLCFLEILHTAKECYVKLENILSLISFSLVERILFFLRQIIAYLINK